MTQETMDSVSPVNTELQRLQAISTKVNMIQEYLESRLERQKINLLGLLCGAKWRIICMNDTKESKRLVRKVQMEIGTFDYRVKEQGETLTRLLCDLDNILSHGNEEIRIARKALVTRIQELLNTADNWKNKSAKVLEFSEKMLNAITSQLKDVEASDTKNNMDCEASQDTKETEASVDAENKKNDHKAEDSMDIESNEVLDNDNVHGENINNDEAMDQDNDSDAESSDEEIENENQEMEATEDTNSTFQPKWKPSYHYEKRYDGLYLVVDVKCPSINALRIQFSPPYRNALHVTIDKRPTNRDLAIMRLSGIPTFGHAEFTINVPTDIVSVEDATQRLRPDGKLEIRFPFYTAYIPMQRMHMFQPYPVYRRCPVW